MAILEGDRTVNRQKGVSFNLSHSFHLNPILNGVLQQLHVLLAVDRQSLPSDAKTVVFGALTVALGYTRNVHYNSGTYK